MLILLPESILVLLCILFRVNHFQITVSQSPQHVGSGCTSHKTYYVQRLQIHTNLYFPIFLWNSNYSRTPGKGKLGNNPFFFHLLNSSSTLENNESGMFQGVDKAYGLTFGFSCMSYGSPRFPSPSRKILQRIHTLHRFLVELSC